MFVTTLVLIGLLFLIIVVQGISTFAYLNWFRNYRCPLSRNPGCLARLVVLALRGTDPFLRMLAAILARLDYPQFEIHVVVDHEADPARVPVERWIEDHPQIAIQLHILNEISPRSAFEDECDSAEMLKADCWKCRCRGYGRCGHHGLSKLAA